MMTVRTHTAIAISAVIGAVLLTSACSGGDETSSPTPDVSGGIITATGNTTPRARRTPTASATPTPTPLEVCAPNPDPAPASLLQLLEPKPGAQVEIPVHVRGWASTFEPGTTISLAVVDAKQNVRQVNNLPPEPRDHRVAPPGLDVTPNAYPFAADIILNDVSSPTPFCLWAYISVDAEGHAKQVVQIPVVFLPRN
jgi:hypothetical protein